MSTYWLRVKQSRPGVGPANTGKPPASKTALVEKSVKGPTKPLLITSPTSKDVGSPLGSNAKGTGKAKASAKAHDHALKPLALS